MAKKEMYPAEENSENIVGVDEPKYTPSKEGDVTLVFKENRAFDLHIGNIVYRFVGQEAIPVPRSVLTHKDFTEEISTYFIVKE